MCAHRCETGERLGDLVEVGGGSASPARRWCCGHPRSSATALRSSRCEDSPEQRSRRAAPWRPSHRRDPQSEQVLPSRRSDRRRCSPTSTSTSTAGEFVALMGPSGSGKSTLLNLIAGIDKPSGGRLRVAGQDIAALSEARARRLARRHVGFIFQFYNLMPVLTAFENVELPLLLTGLSARRAARARGGGAGDGRALRPHRRTIPPSSRADSSSVWRSPARSSPTRPSWWPTSRPATSTAQSAADVLELMDQLNAELGKTIIMVTHDQRAAERRAAADAPRQGCADR